jgi:hypothetical protein
MTVRVPNVVQTSNIKEARARPGLLRIMLARLCLRLSTRLADCAVRLMGL